MMIGSAILDSNRPSCRSPEVEDESDNGTAFDAFRLASSAAPLPLLPVHPAPIEARRKSFAGRHGCCSFRVRESALCSEVPKQDDTDTQ
jgi:hypothetical protein